MAGPDSDNGRAMCRPPEHFSLAGSMWLSGSLRGGARRTIWKPVLMFQSTFKKFIVLIPKVLWELFLFALYHFTGGESRNKR